MTKSLNQRMHSFVQSELQKLESTPKSLPFSREEYDSRAQKLRGMMQDEGFDLLLITSPEAIAWLSGFGLRWNKGQGPSQWPALQCIAMRADKENLIHFETEEHSYMTNMYSAIEDVRLSGPEELEPMLAFIVKELQKEGWLKGRVGQEHMSYIPNRFVSEKVQQAIEAQGCEVRDASLMVRRARRVKSAAELELIEQAAKVCDAGLLALKHAMRPGITERELWLELMRGMVEAGGEPAALHELVRIGPVQLGHDFSGDKKLQIGDYVCADPSGVVNQYHANVAASFYLGEPPEEAVKLAEIAGGAFEVLRDTAAAGVKIQTVNDALLEYYQSHDVWGLHAWTGGYEIGLSFPPDWVGEFVFNVGEEEEGVFEEGLVTNYESVLNFAMIDTVVFESNGVRLLSQLPHELHVVEV